jgi:prophage antirepressor-like protein
MSNEIQRFDFKGESLRALTNMAGEPWFVLKDCMSILDLGNPTETVKMFDDDEFSTTEVIDSIGRRQQAYIISEPGLYRLVMRSRKPEAKEFQRWVTHELRQWLVDNGWIYRQPNQSWCAASSRVRQGHMVMVSSRSHGIHKDGTPFAYPPTPKLTRKGLALIHQRLSEQSFERVLDAEVAA